MLAICGTSRPVVLPYDHFEVWQTFSHLLYSPNRDGKMNISKKQHATQLEAAAITHTRYQGARNKVGIIRVCQTTSISSTVTMSESRRWPHRTDTVRQPLPHLASGVGSETPQMHWFLMVRFNLKWQLSVSTIMWKSLQWTPLIHLSFETPAVGPESLFLLYWYRESICGLPHYCPQFSQSTFSSTHSPVCLGNDVAR